MNKIILSALTIALLLGACTQNNTKNLAIIKGKAHSDVKEIKFEWFKQHSADMKRPQHLAKVDSLGNFEISIPVQNISKGEMLVNKRSYDMIIQANDRLEINITKDTVTFNGKGAEKNKFLQILSQNKKCSKMNIMISWYREQHEFSEFFSMIEEYVDIRNAEFEKYNNSHSLNPEFIEYFNIKNELDQIDMYQQASIIYSRKNRIPIDSVQIPSKYKKQYTLKGFAKDQYLIADNYLDILYQFIRNEVNKLQSINRNLETDSLRLAIIMDSLPEKTKEHCLVQELYYDFSIYDKYDSTMMASFNKIKSDINCINFIDNELSKFNKKNAMIGAPLHKDFLQTVVYDTTNTKMTISDILSKNKEKVIYMDIWSLGCGPCRIAMPHSKKLHEKLKKYPIEFIYMTVDSYSDKLWNEVYEVSQEKENQYRFEKGFNSKLHQLFNIIIIPTYILIDKEGKLVSYNAERPNKGRQDNPDLEKILIKLAS
ncbi:TlpA family protein disulfide reductase [Marinifilum sp. RC60d5]|uniref:TlpA family protein disulfide reductase n=1 Tax=Marinifilum sp. RC60d5 TaxID=3458414 RepID=UPI004036E4BF